MFANYARYYDLLYRDKDYSGEVNYVGKLLQECAPNARSLLELGCGTGVHAALLAEKGYEICGVDRSADMLEQAEKRSQQLPDNLAAKLQFCRGDIRHVRLNQKFDGAIALFHVISYQTTNTDLQSVFSTVKSHLKPGGTFIFDCWYGPAVLSDPPTVRVKRLENAEIAVTRIAEPVTHPNSNLVDVNYQVFIKNKQTEVVDELSETHQMRYLFKPEIDFLSEKSGFEVIQCGEWMTDKEPGFKTWSVYFICRAF